MRGPAAPANPGNLTDSTSPVEPRPEALLCPFDHDLGAAHPCLADGAGSLPPGPDDETNLGVTCGQRDGTNQLDEVASNQFTG